MEVVEDRGDGGHRAVAIQIADPSQVGEARRVAAKLAADIGLDEVATGRVALIATELGTNILKHATRGQLMLRPRGDQPGGGVEIVSIDSGPGISDLDRALRDGFSTAGSTGTGLGALGRLASSFDVFSGTGRGTVLVARVVTDQRGTTKSALELGVIQVPKVDEAICGDDWGLTMRTSGSSLLVVADGLGHGVSAADAAATATRIGAGRPEESALETVTAIHAGLRGTRGAAVAAAAISADGRSVCFSGLGNISAFIVVPGRMKTLVSQPGIAGHSARKIQEFDYPFPDGALLVMHSDGVSGKWDLDDYPGLLSRDPSIIAAVIYRDFTRDRDDAIVIVARIPSEQ